MLGVKLGGCLQHHAESVGVLRAFAFPRAMCKAGPNKGGAISL